MDSGHNHGAGITFFVGSAALGAVSWVDLIDLVIRWGAGIASIICGVAGFVYYGKQNGWWK